MPTVFRVKIYTYTAKKEWEMRYWLSHQTSYLVALIYRCDHFNEHLKTKYLFFFFENIGWTSLMPRRIFLLPSFHRIGISKKFPLGAWAFLFGNLLLWDLYTPRLTGYYITGPCDTGDLPYIINSTSQTHARHGAVETQTANENNTSNIPANIKI